MPINAYTGLMGSGKSYEVVENVILPALLIGRRVVTNVANLQVDAITAHLVAHHSADASKVGQIVQVQNEDVAKPYFFPKEVVVGAPVDSTPTVVRGGDLVVIDECWRWWATGMKITPEHMAFFRMHRHFIDPVTSVSCDIVLVVQDIGDLDRKLKAVVENTYLMTKLKALGLTKRYRVDIYTRVRMRTPYRSLQRKYDKDIFELYRSYSQGGGQAGNEVAIDGRANIFKGLLFTVVLPLGLVVLVVAVWFVWRFFHPAPPVSKVAASAPAAVVPSGPGAAPRVPGAASVSGESEWRVVGHYAFAGNHHVIISRGRLTRTLINPRGFYFDALRGYGTLDGLQLTNYSGAPEASSFLPGEKK